MYAYACANVLPGALTAGQVDDIYTYMSESNRSITLGVPGWDGLISSRAPFGLAFGLLQHDMVERFLLHFYAISAHAYTRGTWTTPESASIVDRDSPATAYASPGIHSVPMYLKWMLVFEEPETKTLWLGKATPREWLEAEEKPVEVLQATTRYGRVSFSLTASGGSSATEGGVAGGGYSVAVNVTVPVSFGTTRKPAGGLRVRIRAPLAHAGKLSSVTVDGKPWKAFDAGAETVDFASGALTPKLVAHGLPDIVAHFG